jgi:hypothetical protein
VLPVLAHVRKWVPEPAGTTGLADRKSKQYFLSDRLAFLILSTSLAFLTVSSFPNLSERITVTTVHLCSWIWIERNLQW